MSRLHSRRCRLSVEPLEDRRLLTARLWLGSIEVTGTNQHDLITVSVVNVSGKDLYRIAEHVNGTLAVQTDFDPARVSWPKVYFRSFEGNDVFQYGIAPTAAAPHLPIDGDGGDSNDTFIGGPLNDRFFGGNGVDVARGRGGNDWFTGGHGDDLLYGQAGNDTLEGGLGRDQLYGAKGDDYLCGDFMRPIDDLDVDHLSGGVGKDKFKRVMTNDVFADFRAEQGDTYVGAVRM